VRKEIEIIFNIIIIVIIIIEPIVPVGSEGSLPILPTSISCQKPQFIPASPRPLTTDLLQLFFSPPLLLLP
jgi:hypothetical protein